MSPRDPRHRGPTNVMTIDVEDYFQVSAFDGIVPRARWGAMDCRVRSNTTRLLRLLADGQVRATFFVLGWIAHRYPEVVRDIVEQGHEIASHGFGHRRIHEQAPDAFRWDVRRAKLTLEDVAGVEVVGYRAPTFSITSKTLWALDVLIEEGYRYDASIFPIRHDRYGIADSPRHAYRIERRAGTIVELPASTVRMVGMNLPIGGGGYFRLMPYWWTSRGIRRVNHREHQPAVFYLHPWELDPDQPRLPVPLLTRVRHYHNLHRTEERLRRLIAEFRFASVREILPSLVLEAPTQGLLAPVVEVG